MGRSVEGELAFYTAASDSLCLTPWSILGPMKKTVQRDYPAILATSAQPVHRAFHFTAPGDSGHRPGHAGHRAPPSKGIAAVASAASSWSGCPGQSAALS